MKKTKKISINLTEEEFNVVQWLATQERRTISEMVALIVVDNSQRLFEERQPKGEWKKAHFCPNLMDNLPKL